MPHHRIPLAASLAVAAALAAGPAQAAPLPYDFNGDGRQDLVAGIPAYKDAGQAYAGAAAVLHGTRGGVSLDEQLLAQSALKGVTPGGGDAFGRALASGDFNGDGHADLAVGAPGAGFDEPGQPQGAVRVIYGTGAKLEPATTQTIAGALGTATAKYANFGVSLVAGDFDADGKDDLAVGANWEDQTDPETTELGSGAVHLYFGGGTGLTTENAKVIARPKRANRDFGLRLAAGDVNRDGHLDLVEAAQGTADDSDGDGSPGHAYVFLGGATGLGKGIVPQGSKWNTTKFSAGAPGPTSIAVGDVTGDRYADVVFGVPSEVYDQDDRPAPHGQVMIWAGTKAGVARKPIVVDQETAGVPGRSQGQDRFGDAVAVGRLDGDRYADIVVGAPGENRSAGRVTIVRGARSGHALRGNVAFDRATRGVPGRKREGETFGSAMTLLDVTGDKRLDVTVGAPARVKDVADALLVLRHPKRGLWSPAGARNITLRTLGLADDSADPFDEAFGGVLGRARSSA